MTSRQKSLGVAGLVLVPILWALLYYESDIQYELWIDEAGYAVQTSLVSSNSGLEGAALYRILVNPVDSNQLVAAGHEIGSHTWSHPYDLTHLSDEAIAQEVDKAHALLSEVRGTPVQGFRAPGYHMTDAVYRALVQSDYLYSSSIFPSPPYYLAKVSIMGLMRLMGKESQAIAGDPRIMVASRHPHHRRSLLELPMTVLPKIRFPIIGTSLILLGKHGMRMLRPAISRIDFYNLEFHGIDMCDAEIDGINLSSQPDLKVPIKQKRATIKDTLEHMRDHWETAPLEKIAPYFKHPQAR